MALRDSINELARQTPQYKLSVLAAVLLALGAVYYQSCYSGMADEKTSLEQVRNSELDKQRRLTKDLEDQKRLSQQNEELQRIIRDNQKALPTEAELPAFFDHLQRKAGDAGVTIRRWERKDEESVDIYIRVPVAMEISGTFYNIMRYFALLGPQQKDPLMDPEEQDERVDERIVSIENLELGSPTLKDGEIFLTAKFVASTFRQQDPGAAGAAQGNQPAGSRPGAARGGRR